MTKVSYEVRKDGFKGAIKCDTYNLAQAKAKQIGGFIKTVYTVIAETPLTEKQLEERAKRQRKIAQKYGIIY